MNPDRFKVRTVNGVKQQCTGLKDIKGNLIYEGDRIYYTRYNPEEVEEWQVIYDESALRFAIVQDILYRGFGQATVKANKVEVIKN